ncbi:MAG: hypothetical protein NTW32_08220 [Chloroflexi bacterium]|nr:hypothetical protein [Chloroflexota bacterium]
MKQDRFLIGILIGIVILVVAALTVFFTRKDNLIYVTEETPEGVVQNYVVALHKRDFDRAYTYLADLPNKPTSEQFHTSFINHSVDPTNAGVEIGKADVSAQTASVSLGLIYSPSDPFSSGYRNAEYAELVRQNGSWKIKQLPFNFWSYEWYQPTSIPAAPVK